MSRAAMTADEVAELLNVSTWTVREAIRNGHLARIPHTGRLVRVTPEAVEACYGVRLDEPVTS